MNRPFSALTTLALLGALAVPSLADAQNQYEVLTKKSKVTFKISTTFNEIEGSAPSVSGEITTPGGTADLATGTTASIKITTKDMTTNHNGRDKDMHNDVLESAKYPEIKLDIKSVSKGSSTFDYKVSADISMHGATKPISISCSVVPTTIGEKTFLSIKGKSKVKITEYGMTPPSILVNKVSPDVVIEFTIIAIPK
jgi:polyisoprenoid-binding protein YceI